VSRYYAGRPKRRRSLAARWHLVALLCLYSCCVAARDPATLYMMECQGCHLADGSGGLNNVPSLHNSVARFLAVPGGREYLVRVPGVAQSALSDADTTAVLNWMLRTFGPPELAMQYAPYTVEEVARLRQAPLTEIVQRRAELMLLMQPEGATSPSGPAQGAL
jgi:hypothetical protein